MRGQAGAPQTTRFPSGMERWRGHRKEQVCSRCKQPRHNQVNYPNQCIEDANENVNESGMNPRRLRGVRHCSICGEIGHIKKRCPTIPIGVLEDEDYFSNDWN
ncbi:hypothetical protein PTKIN_Ptkin18bG0023900 [Pterospermum kingtungense]